MLRFVVLIFPEPVHSVGDVLDPVVVHVQANLDGVLVEDQLAGERVHVLVTAVHVRLLAVGVETTAAVV